MRAWHLQPKAKGDFCPVKLLSSVWLPGPSQSHALGAGSEPRQKGTGHKHAVASEVMDGVKLLSTLVSRWWFLREKANSAWEMQEQEWELKAWIQGDPKRGKSAKEGKEMVLRKA